MDFPQRSAKVKFMAKNNLILDKSFEFSKLIIPLYKKIKEAGYYDIASQLLRSGTSIGANINEAQGTISKKEFSMKIFISLKEARETKYWLRLVSETGIMKVDDLLMDAIEEIIKILVAITKSVKPFQ